MSEQGWGRGGRVAGTYIVEAREECSAVQTGRSAVQCGQGPVSIWEAPGCGCRSRFTRGGVHGKWGGGCSRYGTPLLYLRISPPAGLL